MAIASGIPVTPLSVIYRRADGVPHGVRLRIALDVLEALAAQKFSLARRNGEGVSLASVTVGTDGTGRVAVGSATTGAPELVWEVLAGCPAEGDLRSLREVVDEIPIDVSELVEKVLGDDPELASTAELLEALERAAEGHVASREDVIEIAGATSAAATAAPAPAESAKAAPAEAQPPEPKLATPKPAVPKPAAPKPAAPRVAQPKSIEQHTESKAEASLFEDDWDTGATADTPWPAKAGLDAQNIRPADSRAAHAEARQIEVPSMKQTLAFGAPRPPLSGGSPPPPKAAARRAPTMRYPQKSAPELAAPAVPPVDSEKPSQVEPPPLNPESEQAPAQSIELPIAPGDSPKAEEIEALPATATEPAQPLEAPVPPLTPEVIENAAKADPPASDTQQEAPIRALEFGPRPQPPVPEAVAAPIHAPAPAMPRAGENFTIKGTQIIRAPAAPATPPNTSAAAFERTLRPEETAAPGANPGTPPPSVGRTKLESFDESMATRRRPARALGKRQLGVGVILASIVALVVLAVIAILASH